MVVGVMPVAVVIVVAANVAQRVALFTLATRHSQSFLLPPLQPPSRVCLLNSITEEWCANCAPGKAEQRTTSSCQARRSL